MTSPTLAAFKKYLLATRGTGLCTWLLSTWSEVERLHGYPETRKRVMRLKIEAKTNFTLSPEDLSALDEVLALQNPVALETWLKETQPAPPETEFPALQKHILKNLDLTETIQKWWALPSPRHINIQQVCKHHRYSPGVKEAKFLIDQLKAGTFDSWLQGSEPQKPTIYTKWCPNKECGTPFLIEVNSPKSARSDKLRPHYPDSSRGTTVFRCRDCAAWLLEDDKDLDSPRETTQITPFETFKLKFFADPHWAALVIEKWKKYKKAFKPAFRHDYMNQWFNREHGFILPDSDMPSVVALIEERSPKHPALGTEYGQPGQGKTSAVMNTPREYIRAFHTEFTPEDFRGYPTQEPESMKPINVETKTFVNGTDVKDMTDDYIYAAIANSEAEIKKLKDLTAQPKRLQKRIAELQKGIDDLVTVLDAKE